MVREVKSNWPNTHPDNQSLRDFEEYDDLLKILNPNRNEKNSDKNKTTDQTEQSQ